jgi:hypothetical protein
MAPAIGVPRFFLKVFVTLKRADGFKKTVRRKLYQIRSFPYSTGNSLSDKFRFKDSWVIFNLGYCSLTICPNLTNA